MKPEQIGVIAIVAVAGVFFWRGLRWFWQRKPHPNPWNEETEARIQQSDAVPLCTRCLEPHEPTAQFCPNCGLPVDSLVPFSPYLYVFALGDVLVSGTTRKFRVNWLTVFGYIFLSSIEYTIFAPVYWFLLFRNLKQNTPPPSGTHNDGANPGHSGTT